MKVKKCPNCKRKNGFLAFREVKLGNQKYPYIAHYDPAKYEKEKKDYLSGKRKSKPGGRKVCTISLWETLSLDFNEDWYKDYLKLIEKIHRKFHRFGFMNNKELNEFGKNFPKMFRLEKIREKFIKNLHWHEDWKHSQRLLEKIGYSKVLANKKIRVDIFFRFELSRVNTNDFKHQFLYNIFLD